MSFNVAMLKQMQSEGLDFDAAIRVLEAGEKGKDATNAVRQARHRRKKAESNGVTVTRYGGSKERDNQTSPEIQNSEPEGSSQKFVLPADIPAEPWAGWEEMRKRIRKTPTNKARGLAVSELRRLRDEEGWPPGEVLNHCVMNSYQGIYPPNRNQRNERSDADPTTIAVHRLVGARS